MHVGRLFPSGPAVGPGELCALGGGGVKAGGCSGYVRM